MLRLHDLALRLQESNALEVLLPLLLKATLIALIGRLLIAALPRASAATRYLIMLATLASLIVLPLVTAAGIEWRLAVLPAEETDLGVAPPPQAALRADAGEGAGATLSPLRDVLPRPVQRTISFAEQVRASWRGWLLLAVAAVAGAFLARMIVGVVVVWWVTRHASEVQDDFVARDFDHACGQIGVDRFVRLLISESVPVPLVWGFARPVLLLPAQAMEWSRERLQVVFLHELAHLRRRDAFTLMITRSAVAFYWFHPLVWALERIARRECERACDDAVLESGTRASDYADHLLSIARTMPVHDPFGAVTLAMSRRSELEGRLISILQAHARRGSVSRPAIIAAVVLSLAFVVPVAAIKLTAAPAPKAKQTDATIDVVAAKAAKRGVNSDAIADGVAGGVGGALEELDAGHYYHLGTKLLHEDRYADAVGVFKKSIELGHRRAESAYNIACAYARLEERNLAFRWIETAAAWGFDDVDHYIDDHDFDALRDDPRFKAFLDRLAHGRADDRVEGYLNRYEHLRSEGNEEGAHYSDVGRELLKVRKLDRAVDALQDAVRLTPNDYVAHYNLACAYALNGDRERAIASLEQAVLRGYTGDKITRDPDLASLRNDDRFQRIARMARDLSLTPPGRHGEQDEQWWSDVARHHERMTGEYPALGRPWFNLGFARLRAGDATGSVDAFARSLSLGYRTTTSMYNLACANAQAGKRDAAIEWLMKAKAAGFDIVDYIHDDEDLHPLRGDPRFEELLRQHEKRKKKHEEW